MKNSSAVHREPAQRPKIKNPEFFRLVESSGIIDRGFINDLLEEFDHNALDVLATMIQSGIASKRKLCQLWTDSIGIAHVDLEKTIFQRDVVKKVPERIARMYYAIPVYQMGDTVTIATATPDNKNVEEILREATGGPVSLVFALPQDIETYIDQEYSGSNAVLEFFNKLAASKLFKAQKDITPQNLMDAGGESVINQLHVAVILYAVTQAASEIRISADAGQARLDYRIPYGEKISFNVEKSIYDQLVARLKTMAGFEGTGTASEQYGRIRMPTPGKKIDLKFESKPGDSGPIVMLKLTGLRPFPRTSPLQALYLSHHILGIVKEHLKRPGGHILIAGPPKSGKTTMAYAILGERAIFSKKTVTIEHVVKHFLPGIEQTIVNPDAGITSPNLLKSAIDEKADTLYIQDIEASGLAGKASEVFGSGHYMISGIQADNTLDALKKIAALGAGITPDVVLAQQLVARLCDICKVKYPLNPDHIHSIFETEGKPEVYAWRGNGCPYCNETGFSGLIAIQECLVIDDPVRKLLIEGASAVTIRQTIKPENRYTMHYDAIKKVLRGLTTFDEIHRLPFS